MILWAQITIKLRASKLNIVCIKVFNSTHKNSHICSESEFEVKLYGILNNNFYLKLTKNIYYFTTYPTE